MLAPDTQRHTHLCKHTLFGWKEAQRPILIDLGTHEQILESHQWLALEPLVDDWLLL